MAQINKSSDYFNTKLYTGNGGTQSITGVGFQPDLVWLKERNTAVSHMLFDSIRGATTRLYSDGNFAEDSNVNSLTSFDSDGFSLGSGGSNNGSSDTYVSWNWLASNTTTSNTDGSITSTVSANTTSGFSVVSWTGNGTAGATVGHGLSSTPKMFFVKNRSTTGSWIVYHQATGGTKFAKLNTTDVFATEIAAWNNTSPTSSVFSLGNSSEVNGSGTTMIAYCFAEKKGFSKFGSYTGNGSTDGTFVYTGFKPAFVIQKNTSVTQGWQLQDNKRLGYNPDNYLLQPHTNQSESALQRIDLLSNGFKVRTTDAGQNASGNNYIFMAFAAEPLTGTNNIPCTAR